MNLFRINGEDLVCGGCGWKYSRLYVLADDEKQASRMYEDGSAGLCAECVTELLIDEKYDIIKDIEKWFEDNHNSACEVCDDRVKRFI